MGCDFADRAYSKAWECFNPRTRMGCDYERIRDITLYGVSIHAPAWGATSGGLGHVAQTLVSIHAPAWGATRKPEIVDLKGRVSIHAPAWGATAVIDKALDDDIVSIHAPAWGATDWLQRERIIREFQSTHPHGVRRDSLNIPISPPSFNPRTRMGCDNRVGWRQGD